MTGTQAAWPASVGLIGAGAMGAALLAGIARTRAPLGPRMVCCDEVPAAASAAAEAVGGRVAPLGEAAGCELVIVAVKPKDMPAVLAEVAEARHVDGVVLSVAAGWTLEALSQALGGGAVVRTMPNLAVRHGSGVVGLAASGCTEETRRAIVDLLRPLGALVEVGEELFPAVTALAGSGPGLVAVVAEGLEEGAVACGLSRPDARAIVQAVLAGTGALLADGGDPAALRQRVSSPGGTTLEGVAVLERGAVRAHLADAVRAAAARASAMARGG